MKPAGVMVVSIVTPFLLVMIAVTVFRVGVAAFFIDLLLEDELVEEAVARQLTGGVNSGVTVKVVEIPTMIVPNVVVVFFSI